MVVGLLAYEIPPNCAECFLCESSRLYDVQALMRGLVTVARGLLSNIPGIVHRWPLTLPSPPPPSSWLFKAAVTIVSGEEQQSRVDLGTTTEPNAIITLHIILHHNHQQLPNWTMACIPDIVEHKASVTFRRPRSVRSRPDTASQVRPSCALIILRFITHYHPVSPPCDIVSYQQTSVSASADICRPKWNLSWPRNSMICDLWRHFWSPCVLLCGAIDGAEAA